MAKYLDETGLAHFWSKVKEKINGKYKIATFTTKKEHFPSSITTSKRSTYLHHKIINEEINETLPDGYKVALITNAGYVYYTSEDDYNSDTSITVSPGQAYVDAPNNGSQYLFIDFGKDTKMYGGKWRFVAILERE